MSKESVIEVPFDSYLKYCSPCMYKGRILMPLKDYLEQYALVPSKRGVIKLLCFKPVPCKNGRMEATKFVGRFIRRSVKAETAVQKQVRLALEWSSKNRAEDGVYGYYWTGQAKELLSLLKTVPEGLLVGVMGYSGQGKTALKFAFSSALRRFYDKQEPKTVEKVEKDGNSTITTTETRPDFNVSIPKWDTGVYKFWKEEMKDSFRMNYRKAFLIDTPDYGRKDVRLINRDLTQLSEFWTDLRAFGYKANVIVFLQKELVKARQQFFLLKMYPLMELTPLKPEEMLEVYRKALGAGSLDPFAAESLTLVAQYSRGIFRRFMRYVNMIVLNMVRRGKETVTVEDVKAVITDAVLMQDAELEFAEMFKSESRKRVAVKMLSFLKERGETDQEMIAEALDVDPSTVGRIMPTLEDNGYVKRKRAEHGKWIVSIAEFHR